MNLLQIEDATVAAEAVRRSSSSSSRLYHLEAAASDMEDSSFLVSDDEEEVEGLSTRQHIKQRRSMAKDDYSPIPVKQHPQHHHHGATASPQKPKSSVINESEASIRLPHQGKTKPLGLALQPRSRFSSSNLQEQEHAAATLHQGQPSNLLLPQNLAATTNTARPTFPHLATTVATALATAEDTYHNSKQVTFTAANAPQATSRPSRMRTRSQSIAITKNNTASRSSMDSSSQDSLDFAEDNDASYNEQLYDNATWRMYHRIVEHRQNQQRYAMKEASSAAHAASYPTSSSRLPIAQGYAASAPALPTHMDEEDDDDGIFEMEL